MMGRLDGIDAVQFGLLGILSHVSILFAQWYRSSRLSDPF